VKHQSVLNRFVVNTLHGVRVKLDKFFEPGPVFPTEEELRKNFPHLADCQCDRKKDIPYIVDITLGLITEVPKYREFCNLEQITQTLFSPGMGGLWGVGIGSYFYRHYLQCNYCGVKKRCEK
jgi:hypothetical protein